MIKRLHSSLFYASDLAKTIDFYARCGFPVTRSGDGVCVKLGDFTLAFIDEQKTPIKNETGLKPKGLGIYTYVEVDDVDAHYKMLLRKGMVIKHGPRNWPWGKREFAVKDPDGYKLVFYAPAKK
ncbi:MAG TPA: VOC family protein [Candidatus Paceibacterota bacterium]|nr:VOC family protein [Candidatus Paceibacterota bacterium]